MTAERSKRSISLGALKPTSLPALGLQNGEKKISLERMAKLLRCRVGELEELQEVFYSLGKPPGSPLTKTVLMQLYHTLGIQASVPEVRAGFEEASSDGETIDFYEFVALMQTKFPPEEQLNELKEAFSAFDEDEDGHINVKDVERTVGKVFPNFTEQEAKEAIAHADRNKRNQLNFEDFCAFATEYWNNEILAKLTPEENPPEGSVKQNEQ
uniref:EF-hand domain-containing protein n=1 Tax=Trichuris muris TaxID=70415 RepID=A0A5S6R4W8_TRIMR